MKVLVYTSLYLEYRDFLNSVVEPYRNIADIYIMNDRKYIWEVGDYDIGISFMYHYKVPRSELDKATWFNFHPAPLPEYKGRNLCYHAIMNGETEFGATLHYMDENFDTGDIIEVRKFFVAPYYTAGDISEAALIESKELFINYFPRIIAGEQFERLPNVGGTYYKKEEILDTMDFKSHFPLGRFVRAITYGDFYPKANIGGVIYKIVKDE